MSLIPYLLQKCLSANAIMNKMSVPRSFPARAHLQPRVLRFMKGPCQTRKLRSFTLQNKQKAPQREAAERVQDGGYLLSRECSTIGAGGLNFSVRDGKRWDPAA